MELPPQKKEFHRELFFACAVFVPLIYYSCLAVTENKGITVFQVTSFLIPSLLLIRLFQIPVTLRWRTDFKKIMIVAGLTLVLSLVLNVLLQYWILLFPIPQELKEGLSRLLSLDTRYGIWLDLLSVALVPAVCEEFFFRGFFQTGLSEILKPRAAVFVSAFFFAFYHLNPWFFPFFFVLGLFFAALYERTRDLGLVVVAHFVNNTCGIILFHVPFGCQWPETSCLKDISRFIMNC